VTPFRLRARLKKLLGLGAAASPPPARPQVPRHDVVFVCPDGTRYTVAAKEGDSLAMASGRGPQPIATGCADSSCGTCAVELIAGAAQISAADDRELSTRSAAGVPEGQRLACRARVEGAGVEVRVLKVLGADLN